MTMRKGEHAMITIDPEYGFGSVEVRRDLAAVPSYSTLSYEVEMLNFVKVRCVRNINNEVIVVLRNYFI